MGELSRAFAAFFIMSTSIGLFSHDALAGVDSLGVALIATESVPAMEPRWKPLLGALSQAIGIPVKVHYFPDYAGAVWSMRDNESQIAWLGNKSAIEAVDFADGEVFAVKADADGAGGHFSYLIARKDSGLRTVDDVKAQAGRLTLAMGGSNSTSGSVVPAYYLFGPLDMDPREAFRRVAIGSHEENWLAVQQGRADVATTASIVYEHLCRERPAACAQLTVIWTSPIIPNDPLVWRKSLSPELKAKISAFFLSYGRPAAGKSKAALKRERSILSGIDTSAFAPSDNSQLQPVRDIQAAGSRQIRAEEPSPSFEVKLLPAAAALDGERHP
ncbi:MAG TPA: phosphate/phosphite/phosphonate ABC transporter substrate-binding protein [Magnetospirillum sp.]|nr:phosphate/phosphite/phosphonate ABC transporter substrate-binding protein [Magnetospirillum sp.]